ncbi:MAG: sulfatase-like hydrolase/transferase [Candidatus Aminicenantes bacterium]|nr:MAG: sulfatase-like hydrolase/transferase [Candidatus Aminicenantes bacterium]
MKLSLPPLPPAARGFFCKNRPWTPQKLFIKQLSYLAVAFSIVMLVTITGCGKTGIKAKNYNLLVITLDTLRADRVGAYGYETAQTPNIDLLAHKGVMFENCYSPVPLTLPAHCSIFTGKYTLAHGARDNGTYLLKENHITLAEKLKTRGYHTFAVIASFVLLAKFGLDQGFDYYDDSLDSHQIDTNYNSEIPAAEVYRKFHQWFEKNYHKRFFAWIHLFDPHSPYKAPKEYADKFEKNLQGRYNAEVAYTDAGVGKIIDTLKTKKILENTLVIIVGDHGEGFGEHQEHGHGVFCYQEALKIPLIFYNPKLFPKPLKIKHRVNLVDIMPTILDLYHLDIPPAIEGKSFVNLLKGEHENQQRSFYFESIHGKEEMNWAPLQGIIHGKYKYISLPEPELYDLENDPKEKNNLFRKNNRTAKEMDNKLMKWMMRLSGTTHDDARRKLTEEDKKHLKTLGYISSFSNQSPTLKHQDPKKGVLLHNKIKDIFKTLITGDYQRTEQEINLLTSKYPDINLPILYDLKHQLYSEKKEPEKVLDTLKEALEKFPKIERFYILYAHELYHLGQIQEAETYCQKLLELNPQFTRALILLGEIREKKGNINQAVKYYEKAVTIEPRNISLKLKYAGLMMKKQDYKQALSIYDELLERKEVSQDAELLFKVALLNVRFGTLEKSEQLLKQAVRIKPNGKYHYNYALILSRNQKIKQALINMKIALEKYSSELSEKQIQIAQKAVELWQ